MTTSNVPSEQAAREEFRGVFEKLWERTVYADSGCWLWQGALDSRGYGRTRWAGDYFQVHRLAHEALIGPIPEGLVVDHVLTNGCVHRNCWNPAHLEAVTTVENNHRIPGWVREKCPRGHEMTSENTVIQKTARGYGNRMCRECRRESGRASAKRRYWIKKGVQA